MTNLPWEAPARIILPDEAEEPVRHEDLTLARAIEIVVEAFPSDRITDVRIEFQGGTLEGQVIATIYHSPRFPHSRPRGRKSTGGQLAPDKRRHQAA